MAFAQNAAPTHLACLATPWSHLHNCVAASVRQNLTAWALFSNILSCIMPTSAELIAKVKRRQDKKRADKAQGVEPKPKRQNVGGSKAAVAADISEKLDKSAKTGKNSMAGLTSLMVLSLTARMRAIESMVMWVYNMLTEDEIFDCKDASNRINGDVGIQYAHRR